LTNGSTQSLQLATNTPAVISLPIAANAQGIAPNTALLWYFDTTSGIWRQQGTAVRNGANYVATVSHFTYWAIAGDSLYPANDSSYLILKVFGNTYTWTPPVSVTGYFFNDSLPYETTLIGGDPSDTGDSSTYLLLAIYNSNLQSGSYPFTLYTIINGSQTYNTYYPNYNPNTVVTQYDNVGGYIVGTATGWIKNFPTATTDSFPFTCSYKVKRIQ
jgi:hypothetical protein